MIPLPQSVMHILCGYDAIWARNCRSTVQGHEMGLVVLDVVRAVQCCLAVERWLRSLRGMTATLIHRCTGTLNAGTGTGTTTLLRYMQHTYMGVFVISSCLAS